MVAWAVKGMGGTLPRTESRMLPDNMAAAAINCDLSSGAIDALPALVEVHDFHDLTFRRGYRFPNADGTDEVWVGLPSEFSSVVRSPLANDTNRRVYWTNPGDAAPWWNTYARLDAGQSDYNLGIPQPSTVTGPTVVATGGTATPLVSRSYVYTYINEYGEESAPSAPSTVVTGASDGTWTISNLPLGAPANPAGRNYPGVTTVRLYRTVTGQQTGAQFFQVAEWDFPFVPASYVDVTSDTTVVNNTALESSGWGNPPDNLDGLTALPGGMLVGFVGNTIHFCEPNRPHAWPAAYDQSLLYDIVGMGAWQQSLAVMTSGFPAVGSGNSPANYTFQTIQVSEPCISRGSIVTDPTGVYYASNNGLVMLSSFGVKNQTLDMLTIKQWVNDYAAADIIACRHAAQYLAINGTGVGFAIDYADKRLGVVDFNTFTDAVCVWNDIHNGETYVIAAGIVYRWDDPDATDPLVFRWRSKQFYSPAPISIGAVQIALDPTVVTATAGDTPPLDNDDATLVLPDGVNALFRIYAGANLALIGTRHLRKATEIFRVPGGFKAFDWQFEVVSRVKIHSVELATTMHELSGA